MSVCTFSDVAAHKRPDFNLVVLFFLFFVFVLFFVCLFFSKQNNNEFNIK